MATKLYPIGMQTFSEIREEDFLYVDKTEYVYRMTHTSGKFFFLSRPRRFGKSLLISTFESYFEGKKELFKGLAIEKLEKEWTEYPVLHFSLAGGKHMEKKQLVRYLLYILEKNEKKFGVVNNSPDPNVRMHQEYAGICGITKEELVDKFAEDIDKLAGRLELTHEQALAKLKENYDGYHFTWPSSDIFNPYSLLNCLAEGQMNSYWFG